MKKKSLLLVFAYLIAFASLTVEAKSPSGKSWQFLLDDQLSNFDKFLGVPHFSIKNLPDYPKGDGMKGTPIGLNKDPLNVFTVFKENEDVILYISGQMYGGLSTKQEYGNYHMITEFKWGEKKYEPRLNAPRDNGILYHCLEPQGAFWNVWMHSVEFQVQEHDMGDLYALSQRKLNVKAVLDKDSLWIYNPKTEFVDFGGGAKGKNKGRCKRSVDFEKPNGEWNTLELICVGDVSLHIVNGHVVNVIHQNNNAESKDQIKFLSKGKIQIQSEGAEAYYKNIRIKSINKIPKVYLKQL